ncbi:MAG: glycoside hydrolase [Clostridium sp.]|nr:glycoside hydrolase [Clostridium sp.]
MKRLILKKILAMVTTVMMMGSVIPTVQVKANEEEVKNEVTKEDNEEPSKDPSDEKEKPNYAKAFQLSMYFYDANKCGEVEGKDRLGYRGNCHLEDKKIPLKAKDEQGYGTNLSEEFIKENKDSLDPDGDGCVDLSGGYHDAGDHVKFGLPQSYSASTLGWGYYEFKDAYEKLGDEDHIEDILKWFNDYFMRCTFKNEKGDVVAFAYQVGDGTTDHCYWGSPELQTTARPAFFATSETPASDQCAGAAASLAINYLNFKDKDEDYAVKSLEDAKALYKFAKENRGLGFSGGFYNSAYDEDEMSWAAVWLYTATGDKSYINDITSVDSQGNYTGYMKKIISTTDSTWQNIWVHSWDVVWGGVFAKLAPITNDPEHWYFFRWNIEYWSGVQHENPNDKTFMEPTPGGFRVVNTWGSARYNAAAQLCALVYNKYKPNDEFVKWSKSQMDYILGDNPMHRSYEVGYSENSAKYPHHRAAHGSETNSMEDPVECKHTLWGALVGGPDQKDFHKDVRTDFVYNEVAIDYNAGFVGALAGLYDIYGEGQEKIANFPPKEVDEKPYYVTSKIEQENSERTQFTARIHNETSCPPVKQSALKARYYFNISEMLEAGQSIDDLSVQVMYDQGKSVDNIETKVNGPFEWDKENGIYYVELDWTGNNFHGSREIQVALVGAQDSNYKVHWEPLNDWSREGLDKEAEVDTTHIPVYLNDEKVYGEEAKKSATISLDEPLDGAEFNYDNEKAIVLKANVKENDEKIDKVEFYCDDEKVGEAEKEPYAIKFSLENKNDKPLTDEYGINYIIKAKAITNDGRIIESNSAKIYVEYLIPLPAPIGISSPQDGAILDTTKGDGSLSVKAQTTGFGDVKKIEVYADDEKVGEDIGVGDEGAQKKFEVLYNAPKGLKGIKNVELKVYAVLIDGTRINCRTINIKVKYPYDDALKVTMTPNSTEDVTNDIGGKYVLVNAGKESIDLNNIKIRYYFTQDSDVKNNFYCDSASMSFNEAPWYVNVEKNIKAEFKKLDNTVELADSYVEFSFEKVSDKLTPGASLSFEVRIAKTNWSNFDRSNDYSNKDLNNIVVLDDGVVISGIEP